MIDVYSIKTGDCLFRMNIENRKLCFVIFPFVEYNVCIRHEYEWTENHIRITHYLPIAPSDLKYYGFITVASFKKVAQILNDATEQAYDMVRIAPKYIAPFLGRKTARLYKCITGDYILTTFRQEAQEDAFTLTVSPYELSVSDKPPQDWQIDGAEQRYVDPNMCHMLKTIFEESKRKLVHEFLMLLKSKR